MKKIWKYLENRVIDFIVLFLIFIAALLTSWAINSKYTYTILSSQIIKDVNYTQNFYQVHSEWLMFWLTLIACLFAFCGILIPFLLGQSYKEKVKEMECEFKKHITEVDKYAEIQKTQISDLKNEVRDLRNQAKSSQTNIRKTLGEEIQKYRDEMQRTSDDIKKEIIISEIKALDAEIKKAKDLGNTDKRYLKNNILIEQLKKYLNKFSDDNRFVESLKYYLEDAYYEKALVEFYSYNQYSSAIESLLIVNKLCKENTGDYDKTVFQLLMKAYICVGDYEKAKEMLSKVGDLFPKNISRYLEILSSNPNEEAQELYNLINEKIIRE